MRSNAALEVLASTSCGSQTRRLITRSCTRICPQCHRSVDPTRSFSSARAGGENAPKVRAGMLSGLVERKGSSSSRTGGNGPPMVRAGILSGLVNRTPVQPGRETSVELQQKNRKNAGSSAYGLGSSSRREPDYLSSRQRSEYRSSLDTTSRGSSSDSEGMRSSFLPKWGKTMSQDIAPSSSVNWPGPAEVVPTLRRPAPRQSQSKRVVARAPLAMDSPPPFTLPSPDTPTTPSFRPPSHEPASRSPPQQSAWPIVKPWNSSQPPSTATTTTQEAPIFRKVPHRPEPQAMPRPRRLGSATHRSPQSAAAPPKNAPSPPIPDLHTLPPLPQHRKVDFARVDLETAIPVCFGARKAIVYRSSTFSLRVLPSSSVPPGRPLPFPPKYIHQPKKGIEKVVPLAVITSKAQVSKLSVERTRCMAKFKAALNLILTRGIGLREGEDPIELVNTNFVYFAILQAPLYDQPLEELIPDVVKAFRDAARQISIKH